MPSPPCSIPGAAAPLKARALCGLGLMASRWHRYTAPVPWGRGVEPGCRELARLGTGRGEPRRRGCRHSCPGCTAGPPRRAGLSRSRHCLGPGLGPECKPPPAGGPSPGPPLGPDRGVGRSLGARPDVVVPQGKRSRTSVHRSTWGVAQAEWDAPVGGCCIPAAAGAAARAEWVGRDQVGPR